MKAVAPTFQQFCTSACFVIKMEYIMDYEPSTNSIYIYIYIFSICVYGEMLMMKQLICLKTDEGSED